MEHGNQRDGDAAQAVDEVAAAREQRGVNGVTLEGVRVSGGAAVLFSFELRASDGGVSEDPLGGVELGGVRDSRADGGAPAEPDSVEELLLPAGC